MKIMNDLYFNSMYIKYLTYPFYPYYRAIVSRGQSNQAAAARILRVVNQIMRCNRATAEVSRKLVN